ncbi:class I SAM-dependent methyltransferase [Paraburkholderia nemoris]|uniref:Ubiquinone biosynthesis O-methyltransferase, mitochondrial n=1 Tax=Paraburkholderia nemoris TaxID=2793076 RepID=A0ABN7MZM2_9BURK|nr:MULTISPECIES: class I SAM-dependent methyltransferase [Paraburkholderia]MBK3815334.1 class I SAM-dependent methyltransferase [Paraburkholderia aspalathi]CAE6829878.1 Ubiquinone biosynthesis O-methyltransferase, mitochondrial [Paraburkholderia nemoris]CAE6845747.1 Ubiquinone biosynthesis O-methyltransferase, mitochondrial [Paraburkholderia nemoris]
MNESTQSIGHMAYSGFADRYAAAVTTKPHNAHYERPATMSLLGDVDGLRVLDAGCGPGICSEHLARNGAAVHAFDITPQMVDLARHRCAELPVEVVTGDLAAPLDWLPAQSFDKILCSLALDYVEDLKPVFSEFRRVARVGARLVFSMAHPMRDWMDERTRGGDTYFTTSRFGLYWSGFGEPKPYVQAYRRPLSDILNGLSESGWLLDCFVEPRPLPEMQVASESLYAELSKAPAFICVRARCQ